jgi:hypothetical protein
MRKRRYHNPDNSRERQLPRSPDEALALAKLDDQALSLIIRLVNNEMPGPGAVHSHDTSTPPDCQYAGAKSARSADWRQPRGPTRLTSAVVEPAHAGST